MTWHNRANLLAEAGRIGDAIESYSRVLNLDPANPETWHNRGVARIRCGDYSAAEKDFTRALDLKPSYPEALENRGVARSLQGSHRAQEAIQDFGKALSANPGNANAWHMLGRSFMSLGNNSEALSCWARALGIAPHHAGVLTDRGFLLNALERYPEAAKDFDTAISLRQDDPAAWQGRGIALARLNHEDEAIISFSATLRLCPSDVLALYNRAAVFSSLKRYEDATRDLENLLTINPDFPLARGLLIDANLHRCDWRDLDDQRRQISASLHRGIRAIHPFAHLVICNSPADQLLCARLQTTQAHPAAPTPLYDGRNYDHNRIRIAYLSGDYYEHAVPYLISGVLEQHDHSRFDIYGISYGPNDHSQQRARLEQAFTRFFDVQEQADFAIASLLRELEIDIAIDLKGYTGGARPGILAHRPAPVQVNYLGYPGTMGADYIDYLIADRIVIPPENCRFYSEQIVYLPDSYQANDRARRIAPETPQRSELGLPENAFVFCCFNGNQKILPETFGIWMQILRRTEHSVLWLLENNEDAAANLRREAQSRGVAPERLVFARHERLDRHLARLHLADLVLDTLPYGAHTTASDALWTGVPVLTRIGQSFAGRVAASLLTAAGIPELITRSTAEFENLACDLARNAPMISALKTRLAQNRETTPLFDTARMTCNLESAYVEMWKRRQRNEKPSHLSLR